jgi:Skp family chaperone for outer membrane proteins
MLKILVKPYVVISALALLSSFSGLQAFAKTASPVSVKIGYFNLSLVKASYPEGAGTEMLRTQAESQLKADLDVANKQIQQMQEAKKSSEEIQKAIRDNQLAINAKQQALAQLVQAQSARARERILQAANQVCRDKGIDLAIDGEGLFVGGKTVLDSGVDITSDIVRALQPQSANSAASAGGDDNKR